MVKQKIFDNIKNSYGWKTRKKIVVFAVDDYGNVRLNSKRARLKMNELGLKVLTRFDAYDALETKEDLEILYDTLLSVKDVKNNPAIFTPFAVPCNIDFEKIIEEEYKNYHYEVLPQTFEKLGSLQPEAYNNTWNIWKEGMNMGVLDPQFHGREHLNLKAFKEKLENRDEELIAALSNRSFTSISSSGYDSINYTAAFDFDQLDENNNLSIILKDGLNKFEEVFGYKATCFMPPRAKIHAMHFKLLSDNGIKCIDRAFINKQHQGSGRFKTTFNYTGKRNSLGQIYFVRNVVFEPTQNANFDSVNLALKQIKTAFYWNKPAIISSHRVNFCGHIDKNNRAVGIDSLKRLLTEIVKRWPDVEFMSSRQLGELIRSESIQ